MQIEGHSRMTSWSAFKSLWNFQEFGRERHRDLDILMNIRMGTVGNSGGVYLIGCGNEIVYIGMTNNFRRRILQSLGRCYPLVKDTTLPWSLALAPWGTVDISPEEECWESSAIKAFAPIYNTSIPSMVKSNGSLPTIYADVPIFADQGHETGGAFEADNMQRQKTKAALDPCPPWKSKNMGGT